jgi:hypothetical protein
MKTYVAEINGEAIMAFRAEDDVSALAFVNEENGGFQLGLSEVVRADGRALWDGDSTISRRLATAAEHDQWLKVRNAETGAGADGKQIDPETVDDPDDLNVYLIPVFDPDDEDDGDDGDIHLLSADAIKEIRASLDAAQSTLYEYLDKSFGSYKKAPDDHPVFSALQSIKDVADHFSEEDEEEERINDT